MAGRKRPPSTRRYGTALLSGLERMAGLFQLEIHRHGDSYFAFNERLGNRQFAGYPLPDLGAFRTFWPSTTSPLVQLYGLELACDSVPGPVAPACRVDGRAIVFLHARRFDDSATLRRTFVVACAGL